ncbi:TPA: 8-amino-7-oxononanoate synthase [Candidatus Marinimicrobia bacterium]|nr:MAG: Serine hydroxymethyltransferase [Marinimicrobia bacterium 46_47]KUK92843.1 MAG: Serine hydroxymethyltransferase [Marinimicrobia bacterium 46_43]HAE86698.1 8-amino-7-oxononanoate synthase [Candidatus Neomarinimicrobiota bacterium]HBY18488.1 8-amino-7-oxononanoate synthase [Candidatus Neomarinimicrobiota bacterium]
MLPELKDIAKQKLKARRAKYFSKYPDVFNKMYNFTRAKTAKAFRYYPYFLKIQESDTTEVVIDGKKVLMLGSNNYLGLTKHPEIVEAGIEAIRRYGSGLTGSRFLNGNLVLHDELEIKLARFVGKEAALVFSTGFGVNLGVIATTVGPGDLLFSDELNHASIVDGSRFSRAEIIRFKHNNMKDLENKMSAADKTKGRFIVVDGVFSMEGDIINLPELVQIAGKYGARLMVDDAHSLGVLGPKGNGTAAHFGLTDHVDMIMGTFSKSLACIGGFVAAEEPVIDYLKHNTRTMIFTAALPPSNVAMVSKALDIIEKEPWRREKVLENAAYIQKNLRKMGFDIGMSTTPIVPVIIGEEMKTFRVWKDLFKEGVYTNPVISPAVPENRCLLRTSYMPTHTQSQLDFCLDKFYKVGKKHGIIS